MGKFDGFLLLADIDNTLVYDGTVPQRNVDAIRYFTENGGLFSVATGRTPSGAAYLTDLVTINCPAVCCNGSTVYDLHTGETLSRYNLDPADQRMLIDIFRDYPQFGAEVQDGPECFMVSDSATVREHFRYEHIPVRAARAEDLLDRPWHKGLLMASGDEVPALMKAYEEVRSRPFRHAYAFVTSNGLDTRYLEVHPLESTKSAGCRRLAGLTGAHKLFTIGDYYNDIDMLREADVSAAVGGSPAEVCAAATCTVGPAQEGAVADFIAIIEQREVNHD